MNTYYTFSITKCASPSLRRWANGRLAKLLECPKNLADGDGTDPKIKSYILRFEEATEADNNILYFLMDCWLSHVKSRQVMVDVESL
jgi:hypothetical protein